MSVGGGTVVSSETCQCGACGILGTVGLQLVTC